MNNLLAEFMPHGYCYLWQQGLVGLHLWSDAAIASAYYAIPLMLAYFIWRRQDFIFNWIFLWFSIFILACGTTHLISIWTLWHPDYWVAGAVKAFTAVVSVLTALLVWRLMPQLLALPSPERLQIANHQLELEISERIKVETALRSSQQRLAGILDIAQDAIIAVDRNYCIQLFNQGAEKIFGYKAKEVIDQPLSLLLPERLSTIHHRHMEKFSQSGSITRSMGDRCRILARRQDNTEFIAEASISQLELSEGKIFTAILRDITEREQAEQALRHKTELLEQALHNLQQTQAQLIQSEKMSILGQIVAGIAHEINNPVNFIYGNISYVTEYANQLLQLLHLYGVIYPQPDSAISDKIKEIDLEFLSNDLPNILASMKTGAERIRQIILSLRNFSRLDESEFKQVDVRDGIESTLLILQHRLVSKGDRPNIEVIKNYERLPLLACYPGQLNQVFMHVLTNAIDALEAKWERAIETSNAGDRSCFLAIWISTRVVVDADGQEKIAIEVADSGIGMTEEVCQKVFDPFFTTKPVGKGTGLGMTVSYQIVVKNHGGSLRCTSNPAAGSKVCIELPVKSTPDQLFAA